LETKAFTATSPITGVQGMPPFHEKSCNVRNASSEWDGWAAMNEIVIDPKAFQTIRFHLIVLLVDEAHLLGYSDYFWHIPDSSNRKPEPGKQFVQCKYPLK